MSQSNIPQNDPWPLPADDLLPHLTETLTAYQNAITRLHEQGAEFSAADIAVARQQLEGLLAALYQTHGLRAVE